MDSTVAAADTGATPGPTADSLSLPVPCVLICVMKAVTGPTRWTHTCQGLGQSQAHERAPGVPRAISTTSCPFSWGQDIGRSLAEIPAIVGNEMSCPVVRVCE